MRNTLLTILAATMLTAAPAQADSIVVNLQGDGYGHVGLGGLGGYWDLFHISLSENLKGVIPHDLQFHSGPLIDVVEGFQCPPSDCPTTTYAYENGIVEIDFHWVNGDASIGTGKFAASLIGIVSVVSEENPDSQEGFHSVDEFNLGPGIFDLALSRRLGVKQHTLGGDMSFYLEKIDEGPMLDERFGNLNEPFLHIYAEVPEPASVVLVFGAGVAWALRRRHRKSHGEPDAR